MLYSHLVSFPERCDQIIRRLNCRRAHIRQLIREGRIAEAETLAVSAFTGMPDTQRHYELLGDLFLQFPHPESCEAYR